MLKEMEVNGFMPNGFNYNIFFYGLLKFNDGACTAMEFYREAIGKEVKINNHTPSFVEWNI